MRDEAPFRAMTATCRCRVAFLWASTGCGGQAEGPMAAFRPEGSPEVIYVHEAEPNIEASAFIADEVIVLDGTSAIWVRYVNEVVIVHSGPERVVLFNLYDGRAVQTIQTLSPGDQFTFKVTMTPDIDCTWSADASQLVCPDPGDPTHLLQGLRPAGVHWFPR